ncbi:MAG: hypothetical protein A3D74_05535 [Candidatus Levybacteria bacterium RIFCSPHIGHO2_02_FULL_37_13]|nr:MAG: hypothetical protein A3D74_05535 [Candidatus Levybacteria bacterium RIFCSPHIGHO2_02_FULL_37_13]OGH29124.1 MAG: hypothetical protein A3E40_03195 [Candidatus Levybacteria bacterium RIFCSPHIGHO2_12_FULL_37_9]OGH40406.1 MAG: hypothetical protein A3B41_02760 [Candidatus Levybacteria bacterium RIFCSPLOWO2_01_FULL_37_26]
MKSYEIIPHVADVRLQAKGASLDQLFENALEGMNRILCKDYDRFLNKHLFAKEIAITAYDTTSLLIDFLSEVLTLSHIHKAIFYSIDRLEIYGNSLNARILGVKIEKFMEDIKAVTYHEAEVRKNDEGQYETMIVFDI